MGEIGAGSSESSFSIVVSTSPDRSLVTRHRVPAKKISAATCMSSVWSMKTNHRHLRYKRIGDVGFYCIGGVSAILVRTPGVEPGLAGWEPTVITTRPCPLI